MSNVELQNVSRRFQGETVVDSLSLTIKDGEFLTLLGPSGCGKTTTLRLVAGFLQPDSGRILFDGEDVSPLPPRKRSVGMVFQDYALFPHLTVAENVAFGLRERKHPADKIQERVKEMLELVRLRGFDERLPGELSGGQKQRVALARAVAFPPRLLLMDEPLGALDLKLREAMQMELKRVQKQLQITTVYVTHDQQEAMSMSDRIALMNGGQIVQIGSAREMYELPATKFAARFIGNINFLPVSDIAANANGLQATSFGRPVRLTEARPPASGDCVLALRPEHLRLQPVGGDHASSNVVPGRVIGVRFFGNLLHVDTELGPDQTIVVETHPGDPQAVEGLGVDVCWSPEKGKLLAD